ncbi:MAG: phosphosulfolactate synthase [Solirubrobacterales bacterium]|nr:phosphosulfolactate synthase [Solirubrobacterales bacterium]
MTAGPAGADFLDLPARAAKPRRVGITHALDRGLGVGELESMLGQAGPFVDIVKFGWGTAYVSPTIAEKVACCRRHRVRVCLGGTLLEIAEAQGRTRQLVAWVRELGVDCVEISNGALGMPAQRKLELVAQLSADFTVLAEVGSKRPVTPSASEWIAEMTADLDAGASWVVAEGRESGSVGLYDEAGTIRQPLLAEILAAVGGERVIFEAPRREQQAVLIGRLGPDVNLGNVATDQVISLETLRVGLRADTVSLSCS